MAGTSPAMTTVGPRALDSGLRRNDEGAWGATSQRPFMPGSGRASRPEPHHAEGPEGESRLGSRLRGSERQVTSAHVPAGGSLRALTFLKSIASSLLRWRGGGGRSMSAASGSPFGGAQPSARRGDFWHPHSRSTGWTVRCPVRHRSASWPRALAGAVPGPPGLRWAKWPRPVVMPAGELKRAPPGPYRSDPPVRSRRRSSPRDGSVATRPLAGEDERSVSWAPGAGDRFISRDSIPAIGRPRRPRNIVDAAAPHPDAPSSLRSR